MSRPRVIPTVRSGATVQVQVQPRASASVRLWPGPQGPQGPVGPQGPPGAGFGPSGPAVVASNLLDRPNPTAALPWTLFPTGGPIVVSYNTGDATVGNYATVTVTNATANTGLQRNAIPIQIGRVYTYSTHLRNNGPDPLTVFFGWQGGVTPGTLMVTVPADGQWHRYSVTATVNSLVNPHFRPVAFGFNAPYSLSGTLDVARANITEGAALLDYFDGDSPGARWTGAAGNSTQELVAARQGDINALIAVRTPLELIGTGYPEGVLTAPVGSLYTDTAATNGAVRWIKTSGTGNTGWRVVWGDTGPRNILSLLTNGWTATGATLRRLNDTVWLRVAGLDQTAATADIFLADLGVGWRAIVGQSIMPILTNNAMPHMARLQTPAAAGGFTITNRAGLLGSFNGIVSWMTPDAWPATLP